MTARPVSSSIRQRSGFTLFELLIVLGVIVLMVGMVWPSALAFFRTSTLKDEARRVSETVAATRLAAIDYGVAYQFLYEPDGPHYLMIPADSEPVAGDVSDDGEVVKLPGRAGTLPEDYQFKTPDGIERETVNVSSEMLDDIPDAGDYTGVSWASPAIFYPDGTGTDYRFELENDAEMLIEFSIRSLTGAAVASPMKTREKK